MMLPQPALSLTLSLGTALPVSHQGDNTSHRSRYQHGLCTVSVSRTLGTRTMTRGNHTCHCSAGSFPHYQRQHWSSPSQHRPGMIMDCVLALLGKDGFAHPHASHGPPLFSVEPTQPWRREHRKWPQQRPQLVLLYRHHASYPWQRS